MSTHTRIRSMLEDADRYFSEAGTRGFYLWKNQFLLGLWHLQFGDPSDALPYADRLDEIGSEAGDDLIVAHGHEIRATSHLLSGAASDAHTELSHAVNRYSTGGFRQTCFAHCLDHIAIWMAAVEDAPGAAFVIGSAESIRAGHADATAPTYVRKWHDQASTEALRSLGEDEYRRHFHEGAALAPAEVGDAMQVRLRASV